MNLYKYYLQVCICCRLYIVLPGIMAVGLLFGKGGMV